MREPAFWYRPASFKSHLLRPLAALYGAVTTGSNWRFLRLTGTTIEMEPLEYYLDGLDTSKLGGIAHHMYGSSSDNPAPDSFEGPMRDVASSGVTSPA